MALLTSLMSILILLPLALSQCPSNGRIGPDKQCYAAYNSTGENFPMGWTNAAQYCSKLNGQLVSIHDAFVNAFLWDWSKETWVGDIWIGLWCSVSQTNDQFSWLDKSKYDYKNWMEPAPTNCTEFGNSCAYMQSKDGKWTTYLMCDSLANSFICKF